jgi:threonine/homoserine/homoserine lactone efflux protein
MGMLEGVVSGLVHGGPTGALVGGTVGFFFGRILARAAWRLQQQAPICIMGLVAGAVIKAGGCLLLGKLAQGVAASPAVFFVIVPLGIAYFVWLRMGPAEEERALDGDPTTW